jgi:hypothetical protein
MPKEKNLRFIRFALVVIFVLAAMIILAPLHSKILGPLALMILLVGGARIIYASN